MNGSVPTQAEIARYVKGALKAAAEMKLPVAGFRVTFSQGVPTVEVAVGTDSTPPHPAIEPGGFNVTQLRERIKGYGKRV